MRSLRSLRCLEHLVLSTLARKVGWLSLWCIQYEMEVDSSSTLAPKLQTYELRSPMVYNYLSALLTDLDCRQPNQKYEKSDTSQALLLSLPGKSPQSIPSHTSPYNFGRLSLKVLNRGRHVMHAEPVTEYLLSQVSLGVSVTSTLLDPSFHCRDPYQLFFRVSDPVIAIQIKLWE